MFLSLLLSDIMLWKYSVRGNHQKMIFHTTVTLIQPLCWNVLMWVLVTEAFSLSLSAGVGRTGCFIVIDAMLERVKQEKTIDVYGHVTLMRSQRNYMVQTEEQYVFIYEALLEAVSCGNTEVPARNLYAYIQRLSQTEPPEHISGMEQEFKVSASHECYLWI